MRIITTDTILHGLVAPALTLLHRSHPLLSFDLHAGNELTSLTRRGADIALRATKKPPQHLVGKYVGPIQVALFSAKNAGMKRFDALVAGKSSWIAPDDAVPEHPLVIWRNKHFPRISPTYRVNSILTVAELVGQGLRIGILPIFMTQNQPDLTQLTEVLDECQAELRLLTHTESRHLRRLSIVFNYLSQSLKLD
ncbi:LysR substrate-binding domain-containing protein [Collimonas arenae]|nr:LysR substrate-binding domain-containing protein [Collimonas arenae]